MSIRVKLYMSYLAMVFVPLILIIIFVLFLFYATGQEDVRQFVEKERNEPYQQAIIYGELSYVLKNDAGQLEKLSYQADIQKRLAEQWAGLLISKDDKITAIAPFLNRIAPNEDWHRRLNLSSKTANFNGYRFGASKIDFTYPDGSKGRMILFKRNEIVPLYFRPASNFFYLALIGLTSLLLTYFVSRSIIRPIKKLQAAALQIKDGNLSHKVEATTKGEIGQLSIAFEEMRVRLQQSIEQSLQYEENRKLLLSHISHDLKTPISAIKGYVEGIMDGIANTDEMRKRYMETIYRKASDMDQIIDELFLFSKLDLQMVAFDFKDIDIRRYMEYFLDEQRFDLDESDISLHYVRQEANPLIIAADPEKLGRVLTNILSNCVKYMGQHSELAPKEIKVKVRELEQFVLVEIEDTGPGIETDDLPYIFDRFYRAEQSRNSETGGSGLGLAIVKQIIEGHGGVVWAENAEHGGARFCLKLPKSASVKMVDEHEEHTNH